MFSNGGPRATKGQFGGPRPWIVWEPLQYRIVQYVTLQYSSGSAAWVVGQDHGQQSQEGVTIFIGPK